MSEKIAKIISESDSKPLFRELHLTKEDRSAINVEKRTVELSFASETPVERWYGMEVLDCSSNACDLTRLRQSGPLLVNHDPEDQVGVIDTCDMMNSRGKATVRFGQSARAKEIFQDIVDGIRSLVSVGYRIRETVLASSNDQGETYRATKWEPLEISIVSIPADLSVGVGRSQHSSKNQMETIAPVAPTPPAAPATPPVNVTEIEGRGATTERNRVRSLTNLADRFKVRDLLDKAISDGTDEASFRQIILERQHPTAKPLNESESNPNLGLSRKDIRDYSIVKAIREQGTGGELTGLEKEASAAMEKKLGKRANGFFIPHDIACTRFDESKDLDSARSELIERQIRALSAGSNTAGGFSVGTNLLSGSLIELLRNKTFLDKVGVMNIGGLTGNITIPKIAGGATSYWLPEVGSVTASDQSLGQLVATPNRLSADTAYSKELVMQSSIDIEGLVRNDIARVMAIEKDRAALHGLGAGGEPLGIFNTTGLGTSVTFGGAATWAKILSFETNLATGNADTGAIAWVTSPGTRGKWKAIARFANTNTPLWQDDNTVNGYPAIATNQIAGDKVVFGNWNDMVVFDWAGIDVVVDPYTLKKTGQIEVTVQLWTDIGTRHGASFVISTDTGAA